MIPKCLIHKKYLQKWLILQQISDKRLSVHHEDVETAPPLPPRGTIIFTSAAATPKYQGKCGCKPTIEQLNHVIFRVVYYLLLHDPSRLL